MGSAVSVAVSVMVSVGSVPSASDVASVGSVPSIVASVGTDVSVTEVSEVVSVGLPLSSEQANPPASSVAMGSQWIDFAIVILLESGPILVFMA